MDFESIKRYGLDYIGIDENNSYDTFNPATNNHTIIIHLLKRNSYICPYCKSSSLISRGSKSQMLKFSTSLENNIDIKLYRRVFKCSNCNKHFKENNPFTDSQRTTTIQKDLKILFALKDSNKTYTSIAKEFNVSPTYITNLFDKKVDMRRIKLPTVLAVDEVYSKRLSYHKYCFIMYDIFNRKIIDVLDSRRLNSLEEYFHSISLTERKQVKYFSIDLYDTYRAIAKKWLPNALICADSFHVIKNISTAFQQIRIKIMYKYAHLKYRYDNYYWLFKKFYKLLTKDRSKLSYKRFKVNRQGQYMNTYEIIDYMLSIDNTLSTAYWLLHEYRNFNECANIDNAEEWLNELILKFKSSHINEYIKIWKMLENWKNEIVNSFTRINNRRISNGPMERVNRDIKTLYRLAYGAKNFHRMRNRIMYVINDDAPILYTRKKSTNKYHGKPRGTYKKNK